MGRIETVALTISTTMCETDSWWRAAVQHREPRLVLCNDQEEWDPERAGRLKREGIYV